MLIVGGMAVALDVLPLGVLILVFLAIPMFSARRQLATRRHLSEELSYAFDQDGVRLTAPSFSASLKWSLLREVRETKSAMLLYEGPNIAYIVPKRFFPSVGDLAAWRGAVAAWIKPKSIRSPGVFGRFC